MSKYNFPDGPPRHWLTGSLGSIDTSHIHNSIFDHRDKYGDLSYLKLPGKHVVCVNSVEAIRYMRGSPDIQPFILDRPETVYQKYVIPGDLATSSYSENWYTMRCIGKSRVFKHIVDDEMLRLMNEELACLKSRLRGMKGEEFDPAEAIVDSVTSTCVMLFAGKRFDYMHELFKLFKSYRGYAEQVSKPGANAILLGVPFLRFLPVWHGRTFQNLMATGKEIKKYLLYDLKESMSESTHEKNSDETGQGISVQPNQYPSREENANQSAHGVDKNTGQSDIGEKSLKQSVATEDNPKKSSRPKETPNKSSYNKKINIDDNPSESLNEIPKSERGIIHDMIRAQKTHSFIGDSNLESMVLDIQSIAVVGFNAAVISLVSHLINSDAQNKIYDEIVRVIGKTATPHPNHECHMPYTQAAIMETLRLSNVGPLAVPFSSSEDVVIREYSIPKGTVFLLNLWRIHHDPLIWDDPWTFNPQRFLQDDGTLKPPDSKERRNYMPFGLGKHSCLGQEFVESRIFLYITTLCQAFEIVGDKPGVDPRLYDVGMHAVISPPPFTIKLRDR